MLTLSRAAMCCTIVLLLLFLPRAIATAQGPGPVQPPIVLKSDAGDVPYAGTVTAITENSITIQWTATPGEKPKKFKVSAALATGKVPMKARPIPGRSTLYFVMPSSMYRLTDVKVGDRVVINYSSIGGVITCDHICIQKRPGGRVPPLPEEAEALMKPRPLPPGFGERIYIPYHERMNAYWDLEDKGIPYPEKFGKDRRFPIAPLPRKTEPTGPVIAP